MKHIITIVLTLFLAAFAMAQERIYISICGKTKTSIKWIEERERIGHKLQEELNKFLDRDSDNNMSIAIIISAINYIVLFTRQYHKINGIDFSNPEAWERMEAMISKYVDFIFDNNNL